MRTRTVIVVLLLGVFFASVSPIAAQLFCLGCGPESPSILCGYYCFADGICRGPAPIVNACIDIAVGCVGAENECCECWYGF